MAFLLSLRRGITFFCFIGVQCCLLSQTAGAEFRLIRLEEELRGHIFNNYSILQRPVSDVTNIVTIKMALFFVSVHNLVEKDQVLTSASWLEFRWNDPRLTWRPDDFNGIETLTISTAEVWLPKLLVTNAIEFFPFDKQVCPFFFAFQNQPDTFSVLEVFKGDLLAGFTSAQWQLLDLTWNTTYGHLPSLTPDEPLNRHTVASFYLHLERKSQFYITALLIPSTLLTFLGYITYLAPPNGGERLSLSVSMVLGLTIFQLLMSDLLPITDKQSHFGFHLFVNFVFVALSLPLALININICSGEARFSRLKKDNTCIRHLLLEHLPRLLFVVPLSQRLKRKQRGLKVAPEKNFGEEEEDKQEENNGTVTKEKGEDDVKKEELIEAWLLALVMDRIFFIIFVVAHLVRLPLLAKTILWSRGR
ncbi:neuronal acetylcholine receptor subunit alpha-9-like isoform X2 [Apostichopus japonicus]|uniref:neuronal acetylcholine receptor subunit alpha-9-like isoform X2 n=1 Tax=Stichopus japonicus TaxID=307972 RepID=UPI003AB5DAC9